MSKKLPTKRKTPKQLKETEWRRVKKLKQEYEAKGYVVLTNKEFLCGVDLLIFNTSSGTFSVARAIESTNWNPRGYLNATRYMRYVKALNKYAPTTREIVFSYDSNLSKGQKQGFIANGIIVTIKGYQD